MRRFFFIFVIWVFLGPAASIAEPYKLQTGEVLADSEYQTLHILGGPKRLALKVTFEDRAPDPKIRNASLLEILIEHLLPTGVSKGFSEISIWETKLEHSAGPQKKPLFSLKVTTGAYENYDFVLGDEWVWKQTSGPTLDLSEIPIAEFSYNEELELYTTDALPRLLGDGQIYSEVWANAESATPSKAIEKANALFRSLSGCVEDGVPIDPNSFLAKQGAIALRVYLLPFRKSSPLQFQPRVKLIYGHKDGVATCYTISNENYGSWDDIYSSLSR